MIILKCFNLIELNAKEVDKMSKKVDWNKEMTKRIGIKFNSSLYMDVILPVAFNDTWVLMSWNFETRQIKVLYFQKETRALELNLLMKASDKIWRESCKTGLKCGGGTYFREVLNEKKWSTIASECHREDADHGEAISFKRMVALIYEISCYVNRNVDSVTEEFSELMKRDNGITKMMLASIQGAIAARTLAQCPRVRHI